MPFNPDMAETGGITPSQSSLHIYPCRCTAYTHGKVASFGPVFNFSLVHKHETLEKGNKYGNKISIICTVVSYIYRDQNY
jgi:hypothetical protein